jgi:glycosyltransferase involved in cell wall biosynthesis
MNIVQYLPFLRLEDGGIVRFVLDISAALAGAGVPVKIITLDAMDAPPAWIEEGANPKIVVLPEPIARLGRLTAANLRAVRAELSESSIVHLHTPWFPSNVQVAKLAASARVRYVVSPHGSLDRWSMRQKRLKKLVYLGLFGRSLLTRAAAIHFTADDERDQAGEVLQNLRSMVAPCLVDLTSYYQLPGREHARRELSCLSADRPNILFLSRLHPKKGVELLLHAMIALTARNLRLNLIVAGPEDPAVAGYELHLRQMAAKLGVAASVHFIGMIKGELKISLSQASDLYILPTYQENFGIALVEAMACGTPVITTKNVDTWRELQQGGEVYITDTDPGSIADTIEEALSDRGALTQRGERGRRWVLDYLEMSKVTNSYLDIYKKVAL